MEKSIVSTGKTIDLAIEAALNQLGLDRDSVSVQVLAKRHPRAHWAPLPVPSPRLPKSLKRPRWKHPRQR